MSVGFQSLGRVGNDDIPEIQAHHLLPGIPEQGQRRRIGIDALPVAVGDEDGVR
jgi:hypothetical protein